MNPQQAAANGAPATRRPLPSFVGFVLTIAMVWLGGQVVTQGVSDEYLTSDAELAVLWRGDSSDALAALARQRLTGRDPGGAARLAGRALQFEALNAQALTTLGIALDRQGRQPQADRAMAVAGRLGWRDIVTQIWLFRRLLLAGDFEGALDHADALLRRQNVPPPALLAAMATLARDPRITEPLARHLALAPEWRTRFLDYLSYATQPPATDAAYALLTRLAEGPTPPTDEELATYLRQLVGQQRFAEAASDWRQLTRGAGQHGFVYDGDFERAPGQTPFDWTFDNGVGWSVDVAEAPGQGRGQALRLEYDGVSPPKPVRQLLVLPPGAYRLAGRAYRQGGDAAKALGWGIVCATNREPLAAVTTTPAADAWSAFSVDLDVPAGRCPAQWLLLSAEPGDERVDITVWYDDITVAPVAPPPPGASQTR